MSCCGQTRKTEPVFRSRHQAPPPPLASVQASLPFIYTGATRLVAVGPVTRRTYRFEAPGAVVDVDARDAAAFAAIPHLRRPKPLR